VLEGDISTPAFTLAESASVRRTGGTLRVGTLSGSAVRLADFGTGANVKTLGSFTVTGGTLALANAQALTITGPISAEYIDISATGLLAIGGNITTLGLPRAEQVSSSVPVTPGSSFSVVADATGAALIQVGNVTISPTAGNGLAMVRMQLPASGGAITFANLQAATTDLLLYIGSGSATGHVTLDSLFVSGRQGTTDLTGWLNGLSGQAAARAGDVTPLPDSHYRFNSCPIQSVNCILLPLEGVPPNNPLHDLAVGAARNDQDDPDLLLPNVSDTDY
jgi:hypothetical protein